MVSEPTSLCVTASSGGFGECSRVARAERPADRRVTVFPFPGRPGAQGTADRLRCQPRATPLVAELPAAPADPDLSAPPVLAVDYGTRPRNSRIPTPPGTAP